MSLPLVSVLIPAYNAERYLAEALDSVLAQTWPNIEVVVVDDGSKDATLEVARRYESAKVKVIAQENAGAAAARNTAYAHCHGDYVQFLDADDLLAPDKLERQVRRLEVEPVGTVASCAWSRFYDGDLGTVDFTAQSDWRDFEPAYEWLIQSWSGRGTMTPVAWLVPRTVTEAIGPWDESLSLNDDGEYFARVLVASPKVVFCGEAKGYYRSGLDDSLSKRADAEALRSFFRTCELGEEHLLPVVDTAEARQACAGLWQSFLFTAYPQEPELVRRAEERVEALGGGSRKAGVSRPLLPVRDLIGWKPAVRLQRAYANSGLQELIQRVKA